MAVKSVKEPEFTKLVQTSVRSEEVLPARWSRAPKERLERGRGRKATGNGASGSLCKLSFPGPKET